MSRCSHPEWLNRIRDWQEDADERDIIYHEGRRKLLSAQVINDLWRFTGGDAITVTDVGQHQMVEAQYYPHQRPATLITSGGAGTMGFGLPAVDWREVRPTGRGSLGDCRRRRLPDDPVRAGDGEAGKRQHQYRHHQQRLSGHGAPVAGVLLRGALPSDADGQPDFVKLADAYGIPAMRVTNRDQIEEAVKFAAQRRGSRR